MNVSLEIETSDAPALVKAIIGADAPPGTETVIDDGVGLRYRGTECRRGLTTELVIFALQVPVGISTGMIADIILRHMPKQKHEAEKIRIYTEDWTESQDGEGNLIRRKTVKCVEEIDRQASR